MLTIVGLILSAVALSRPVLADTATPPSDTPTAEVTATPSTNFVADEVLVNLDPAVPPDSILQPLQARGITQQSQIG